jgi:hypothetical protein
VAQKEISRAALDAPATMDSVAGAEPRLWEEGGELPTSEIILNEMGRLLDFALRKLVGIKGTSPGMRTIRSRASPSLMDIAPAVWNLQYLQVKPHIPTYVVKSIDHGYRRWRYTRT